MTSTVEPMVGDKRPREDDAEDQNPNQPPPPASRPNAAQPQLQAQNPAAMPSANQMNSGGQAAMGAMGSQTMNGSMGGTGIGYDALYIGDLQWVRLSRRLVFCAYCSEIIFRNVSWDALFFFFFFAVDD